MDLIPDSQAFGLGYVNEPYRLKTQRNRFSLKGVKAGRSLNWRDLPGLESVHVTRSVALNRLITLVRPCCRFLFPNPDLSEHSLQNKS
jgi:hypothetical protein